MSTLALSGTEDFSGQTLAGIDRIVVQDGARATFDASQFGGNGIADDAQLVYGGNLGAAASVISIGGGSVDLSGWNFAGWPADAHWQLSIDIQGTDGSDIITGSAFDDIIDGHNGNDFLSGGAGNDQIVIGAGKNVVSGGAGNDAISLSQSQGFFVATAIISTDNGNDNVTGDFKSSAIATGNGDDSFSGTLLSSTLAMGAGNDSVTLAGIGGVVNIKTGIGADAVHITNTGYPNGSVIANLGAGDDGFDFSGPGIVKVHGGAGSDTVNIDSRQGQVTVFAGAGHDNIAVTVQSDPQVLLCGGAGRDHISVDDYSTSTKLGSLHIAGGGDDDDIHVNSGSRAAVVISGGTGNDTMSIGLGAGSSGTVAGDAGNDVITVSGTTLSQVVVDGGSGDDTIGGGLGLTLHGGTGNDTFMLSGSPAATPVVIDDFASGADTVDLHAIDADGAGGTFAFIGSGTFSHTAGELRFDQASGHTFVYGDTNGDGVADITIDFVGTINFQATDFVL